VVRDRGGEGGVKNARGRGGSVGGVIWQQQQQHNNKLTTAAAGSSSGRARRGRQKWPFMKWVVASIMKPKVCS